MILINKDVIAKYNPCKSRFDDNYLIHYSDFNGSFDDFLDLDKITYDDKFWVAKKVLNKNQLVHFAILCAQSTLSIYENKYPNDNRIRDCLEYLTTISDFSNLTSNQLQTLREKRAAAYAAYAAADAADAAAYAAADAADAAAYAAYAAAYAAADAADAAAYAAADAADAAADAAAYAADARKNQQDLNLSFLKICSKL